MDEAAKEEMKAFMKDMVTEMQRPLLQAAADNAKKIMESSMKEHSTKLKDEFDEEMAECTGNEKLKNNINESNLDFCRQIKDIWKKAERAVHEKDSQKSTQCFDKGKKIIKNRMQALRIADREGWDVALAFLDDPLVDNPDQEKRLKKARTTVQANKSSHKKRNSNFVAENRWRSRRKNYGADEERSGNSTYQPSSHTGNKRSWGQTNTGPCWICNRFGHFASNCPNSNNKSSRY